MKSFLAIIFIIFALMGCKFGGSFSDSKSNNGNDNKSDNKSLRDENLSEAGSKEDRVKQRIKNLFKLCQEDNHTEAADYFTEESARKIENQCQSIKSLIEGGYEFGKSLSQQKSNGREIIAWEVFFKRGEERVAGAIFAFQEMKEKYVLVDVDPINSAPTASNANQSQSSTQSGSNQSASNTNRSSSNRTIAGGVLNSKAVSLPQPSYPPMAKAARASGPIVVQVIVDETGKVISANASSGHPLLKQAAVNAAFQARFNPTTVNGQAVKVQGTITYNFVL